MPGGNKLDNEINFNDILKSKGLKEKGEPYEKKPKEALN